MAHDQARQSAFMTGLLQFKMPRHKEMALYIIIHVYRLRLSPNHKVQLPVIAALHTFLFLAPIVGQLGPLLRSPDTIRLLPLVAGRLPIHCGFSTRQVIRLGLYAKWRN